MLVLGWHGSFLGAAATERAHAASLDVAGHDAAAVLLRDGEVIAAIEEERLTRVKHGATFPARAIEFCLQQAGVRLVDLDAIALDVSERFVDSWLTRKAVIERLDCGLTAREQLGRLFQDEFDVDVTDKFRFCRHHLAHLYGAWHSAGMREALGLCLDASGDGSSGLISHCSDSGIKPLRFLSLDHSLGHFYLWCIGALGYGLFDEYKVMGLAPYGNPVAFRPLFERMYRLEAEGRFTLCREDECLGMLREAGLARFARRRGETFTKTHQDFAAGLQEALEQIALHVVRHYTKATGLRNLCLSGGVAHNCSMNGVLMRSGLLDRIYIHPAAHDGGNAFGAALSVLREGANPPATKVMPHVYLGTDVPENTELAASLRRWSGLVTARQVTDAPAAAAQLIAAGAVVAWVQGRSEFGPRALGNRSILADPRPAENKQRINAMVKKREGYRPFAPSVLEERLRDYFELPVSMPNSPYMTIVVPVRKDARETLGAITHVDGTARVQTVSRTDNPRYYALIEEFARLTGVALVLNTSLNNDAEPIVDSVDDAVVTFLTTGLTHLVVGDWVVEKVPDVAGHPALLSLVPALSFGRRIGWRRSSLNGQLAPFAEPEYAGAVSSKEVALSSQLARILSEADPFTTVAEHCRRLAIDPLSLTADLFNAWQCRAITLSPPPEVVRSPHDVPETADLFVQ
jgi:carbamoyltransferase